MIDTVFFDWGGVLADDPGDDFLSNLLAKLGATKNQIHDIHSTYMQSFMRGKLTEQAYWQALRETYDFSIAENISDEFLAWNGLVVNKRVRDLVLEVRDHGIKTVLFSNVIEPTYEVLERSGCYEIFDVLVASCKVGYAKPQVEIYDLALSLAHTTAEKSLFVDDKQRNLEPASRKGYSTILAVRPDQIIEDVRRYLG
jgi:epoxide hydrolase-like predicted phosphatase